MTAIDDKTATELLGPKCPDCGWRQAPGKPERHRPALVTMNVQACPQWVAPTEEGEWT